MTVPVSSPWQTLLAHPGPDGHLVQLYQDEGFFGEAVSHFATQGVAQGDAVILVATQPHWDLLADCLADKGLDVVALRRHGQLLLLDADATLPTFLVRTLPDAPTFKALARATIAQARTGSRSGRVRWWGEMVNVLFVTGNGRGSTSRSHSGRWAPTPRRPGPCTSTRCASRGRTSSAAGSASAIT